MGVHYYRCICSGKSKFYLAPGIRECTSGDRRVHPTRFCTTQAAEIVRSFGAPVDLHMGIWEHENRGIEWDACVNGHANGGDVVHERSGVGWKRCSVHFRCDDTTYMTRQIMTQ